MLPRDPSSVPRCLERPLPASWDLALPVPADLGMRLRRLGSALSLYIRLHRSHAPMFTAFPHPTMTKPASEPTTWAISGACPSAYIAVRTLAASEAGHRGDGHFDVVLDVEGQWSSAATGMDGSDETLNLARAHLSPIKDASSRSLPTTHDALRRRTQRSRS